MIPHLALDLFARLHARSQRQPLVHLARRTRRHDDRVDRKLDHIRQNHVDLHRRCRETAAPRLHTAVIFRIIASLHDYVKILVAGPRRGAPP